MTIADDPGNRADPRMSVAAEMEAVFARLPRPVRPVPDPPRAQPVAVPPGNGWRWVTSFVAVVLIAAAILAFMARPIPVASPQPSPRRTTPVAVIPVASAAAPSADHGMAQHAEAPRVAVPPTVTRIAQPKPTRIALKNPGHCPANATEAWCRRAEVAAADERLRDAYGEAVRAGIDRDMLVGVRNDWARLRGRANRDPAALIRGYRELTGQLYAELRDSGQ